MAATLRLTFDTDAGNRVSIPVPMPKEGLTEATVLAAMQAMITADIYRPNGLHLVTPYTAKVVDSTTTVLYKA